MEKGTLIEFRVNGERRLAVADRPEGKKNWIVIDARQQSHSLHPREISHEIPGSSGYKASEIPAFLSQVEPFQAAGDLEVAWELLLEMGESTNPKELANLLFSDQSAPAYYAAYHLLDEDRLYFKQKADRYEPRTPAQVAELKHQKDAGNKRQQEWQAFLGRLEVALQGTPTQWSAQDRPRIDALEKFATFAEEASNKSTATEILSALGRPETAQASFDLLVQLKLWSPHENLLLRRSHTPTSFPQKVVELAQQYLTSYPEDLNDRLDLTRLKVYTIDDESTMEIDDGLSIEYLPEGRQKIWIHIADPTRWLSPNDALDLEARRRGTTIYLPTGMVSMFPTELATGPMSLKAGEICCALSFGILLDETGGVTDFSIHSSHIKITYRLTYDDVEEMLELGVQAEPEIHDLAQWAKLRQSWRQSQGAISINMPEPAVKVKDGGEEVDVYIMESAFSRELVAEMMILAGEVAAKYGQMHNLPMLFRAQQQPELPPDDELMRLPGGPVRSCALRRCMPKSEVSMTPFRHASLGLETYAQVTSPIRRYGDLLAHFQIKAHLRGAELPFPMAKMQEIILSLTPAVQEAIVVERQTNRYWVLEYLRRNGETIWQGLMLRWLREHEGLALIMLEDLGVELVMRFDRPIQLGDRLLVKVAHVDPRQDRIELRETTDAMAMQQMAS